MTEEYTVVILPGWGGTRKSWQPFISAAADNVRVHCIELPCFGDESCPDSVWGVEEYADFAAGKIRSIRTSSRGPVVLIGHSFGGQVAAVLCAKEQHICDGLILSGAAVYRVPQRRARKIFFSSLTTIGKRLFTLPGLRAFGPAARRILYRAADSPDYAETDGIKRDIFKKVIQQDVSDRLAAITCPVLIVWGDSDDYVPVSYAYRIQSVLAQAEIRIFKDTGHGIHISKPAELWSAINGFLLTLTH